MWLSNSLNLFFNRKNKDKDIEEGEVDEEEEQETHPLVTVTKIDPDEIPDIPSNRWSSAKISIKVFFDL